jgi:hypothetical protein
VGVCWPSFVKQLVSPLAAKSDNVLFAQVELMTVPVTTGFPATNENVPAPLKGTVNLLKCKKAALGGPEGV